MRLKILLKRITLLAVVVLGLIFPVTILFSSVPKNLTSGKLDFIIDSAAAFQKQENKITEAVISPVSLKIDQSGRADKPTRLKIPSLKVDSPVEYLGLTPGGAMRAPKSPGNVSWFNLGPRPGEKGSAVIAGHYDWKNNAPAVFKNLDKLRKGDRIYVEDEKGVNTSFIVRAIKLYGKNQNASDVFISSDGKAHLNIITCAGVWNKIQKSYTKRLVVFADKE